MKRVRVLSVLSLGAVLTGLVGCGGDAGKVSVQGTVSMDGQPLAQATVGFITDSGSAMSSATTGGDGKFYAKVAPGKNKVSIAKADMTQAPAAPLSDEQTLSPVDTEMAKLRAAPKPKGGVPERFADPTKSGLTYEIKSGMEPLDISISSK